MRVCFGVISLLPFIYEAFLIAWWTILDRDNPKVKKIRDFNELEKRRKEDAKGSNSSGSSKKK